MLLRVGIVGARRTQQGTGPFVARAFLRAGCEVAGIVGTSRGSVAEAQADLERSHGICCSGYLSTAELLASEQLDALAICTPTARHRADLDIALDRGVHVLCEKPLWWDDACLGDAPATRAAALALAAGFARKGLLLAVNEQWPYTLDFFHKLYPEHEPGRPPRAFTMRLSPTSHGRQMVIDSGSHPISMLQALCGRGTVAGARAETLRRGRDDERIELTFTYRHAAGATEARVTLERCESQPRPAWYEIDGRCAVRSVELPSYRQDLVAEHGRVRLVDPLDLRVQAFVTTARRGEVGDPVLVAEGLGNLIELVAAVEPAVMGTYWGRRVAPGLPARLERLRRGLKPGPR